MPSPASSSAAWCSRTAGGLGHCAPFNLTGSPAVTLPIGLSADPLPIGGQLVGRRWDDLRLLAVAELVAAIAGPGTPPPGLDRSAT